MIYNILGFVILPTLITAFFASVIPRKLKEKQRSNEAATTFRGAFLCEITFLKHNAILPECERTYATLNEFLFAGYVHRHLKAFEIFRNHLSAADRTGIDKAWQKYCKRTDDSNILYFEQYSTKNVSKEREKKLKDLALKNLEDVLKFAEHK